MKNLELRTIYSYENTVCDSAIFKAIVIDRASTLYIKDGTKARVVLYTYAVFLNINLELITYLTTVTFIHAFKRFIVYALESNASYLNVVQVILLKHKKS